MMLRGFGTYRFIPEAARTEPAKRLPFDLSELSVTGLVIICELDDPPPGNSRPTMAMKMTQYLRLSDESMIRLDMDRGVTSFKYGYTEPVSWKRTSADVISEVLTLIQGDEPDPGSFPWEEYAQAARLGESRLRPRRCATSRTRCCCPMNSPRYSSSDQHARDGELSPTAIVRPNCLFVVSVGGLSPHALYGH